MKLRLAGPETLAPPLPDSADPGLQVWPADDGSINAYTYRLNGCYWIQVPRVGSFRFSAGSGEILAIAPSSVTAERIQDIYRRIVLPMARQALGWEVLHASAVLLGGGVAALCGDSRTGKSTIAYALSERGRPIWADDAVAFEISGAGIQAMPLPFRLRLRAETTSFFGLRPPPEQARRRESPEYLPPEPAPLACIVLLQRAPQAEPDGSVVVRRLSPTRAFPAVLAHATCLTLKDATRNRQMMERYLELTARLPVFEVQFRPGLEALPRLLDAIERSASSIQTERS